LVTGELALPYTVSSRGADNSYVCSPESHYIDCAVDELAHIDIPLLAPIAKIIAWPLRRVMQWGKLDKVVMVNNWLLSTNLYVGLNSSQMSEIVSTLQQRYPDHCVLFRSIDLGLRKEMFEAFKGVGGQMVASRRIHIVLDRAAPQRRNSFKNDKRLQRKTPYVAVEHDDLCEGDMPRIRDLYEQLYIGKYSHYNPKFTTAMLTHLWKERLWQFQVHKNEGVIDAVSATFNFHGVRTAPLIGYEMAANKKLGLYRLAFLDLLERGRDHNEAVHCSAGVAAYKQSRGAQSFMEYNAVFHSHLSWRQRLPWNLLKLMTEWVITPMMLRNNL
jgi:hypothetical protein